MIEPLDGAMIGAILEAIPDPLFIKSRDGLIVLINGAGAAVLGRPASEILGKTATELFPPETARLIAEAERTVYASGRGHAIEQRLTTPNGEKTIHVLRVPYRSPQGEIVGIIGITRDITEHKRTEDDLRFQKSLLESQSESGIDGILVVDDEGRMLSLNRRFVELWEIPEPILQSRSDEAAIQSVLGKLIDPEGFQSRIRHLYEHPDEKSHDVIALKDGRFFDRYSAPVRGRDGSRYGRIWFFRDVTERRRADRRLAAQHAVTRILAESSTLAEASPRIFQAIGKSLDWEFGALWRVDRQGDVLRCVEVWHSASARVPEFEASSRGHTFAPGVGLPGRIWSSAKPIWIPDVTKDSNFPRAPVAAREGLRGGFGFPIQSGRTVLGVLEFFSREIREPDADLLEMFDSIGSQMGQFIERRRAEEEIRRAVEEAHRAYQDLKRAQAQLVRSEKLASIGMLVSGVAHEINNPLSVIYGNLKLLSLEIKKAPRRVRTMLRDATKAAEHARTVIEDFRNFARDARTAEPVDLIKCLEEVLALIRRQAGVRVRIATRLRPLPLVRCFRGQMSQVFLNLLKNASEAIEESGTITLRARRVKDTVVIEVADTGRGISDEARSKVFEPFFTTKPVGQGLGLGLSISAAIVHNHGGQISVKSRPGRGSVFRVELPLNTPPEQ